MHRYRQQISGILMLVSLAFITCSSAFADKQSRVSLQASTGRALSKISSTLKSKGISKVPSTSSIVRTSRSSSRVSINAVSGTPPTLKSIDTNIAKTLFWRPGVVDAVAFGTPTQNQCTEFFSSDIDGTSGGDGACIMAESVGLAFQIILDSERSICFMKRLPTVKNLQAGGVRLVRGRFPEDDITELFAPGKRGRIVQVNAPPKPGENGKQQHVFVQVPSQLYNSRRRLSYSAYIHFCEEEDTSPRGFNGITISDTGAINIKLRGSSPDGESINSVLVSGRLTTSGDSIVWDSSKTRTVSISDIRGNDSHKILFTIDSDNLIHLKDRTNTQIGLFKNFAISNFSGSSMSNLRFLQGAFNGHNSNFPPFSGATEFRDTFYASASSNALLDEVDSVDLDSDTFYDDEPEVDTDISSRSCSPDVDIEITMVEGNSTLEDSISVCQNPGFDGTQFCRGRDPSNPTDIDVARQRHSSVCAPPP